MTVWRLCLIELAAFMVAPLAAQEPETAKRIAITFDDIPRAAGVFYTQEERTQVLIQRLEEAGVEQAAFFLNPGRIAESEGAPERIAAYVEAGHVIANHTHTHPRLSQVSAEEFLADIDAASAWLKGRKSTRPWFRYPYLDHGRSDKAKRDAVRAGLAERGLLNAYVTVDASDWFYDGEAQKAMRAGRELNILELGRLFIEVHVEAAEFYADLAMRTHGRQPAHVLLLHETDLVALTLSEMVEALEAKGWQIITADEAYADAIALEAAQYDTPSAGGTLSEQLAWQKGLPSPRWYRLNDTRLAGYEFDIRALGERRYVPGGFGGVWDYEGAACARESDLRIEIAPDTITFYESVGRVMKVAREGDDALVTLEMEGEGETWNQVLRLSPVQKGDSVRLHISDGTKPKVADPLPRKLCGRNEK